MIEILAVFVSLAIIHYKYKDTMVDLIKNLQVVYNKWDDRNQQSLKYDGSDSATPSKISAEMESEKEEKRNGIRRQWTGNAIGGFSPPLRSHYTSHIRWKTQETFKLSSTVPKNSFLGYFKCEPTILSGSMGSRRPYVGLCCNRCLSVSRTSFVDDIVKSFGLNNLLLVPSMNDDRGYFVRKFHYLSHVFSCRTNIEFADVSKDVLGCKSVVDAIEMAATQDAEENDLSKEFYPLIVKKHAKRAYSVLKTMRSRMSRNLLSFIQWVVFKFLSRLLTSVQIHKGQIEIVKRASQSSLPLIFIPLHRSHLDYILVTFILVNNKIKAPLVAAGENLRMPIIGTLLRGLGAFFIKRKMDSGSGKKDYVYRAVLHSYVEKSLQAGHNLEFFIEGGRSRTGKSCVPKGGLLSFIVDAFWDGSVPDALIVPVAINYDKIMDGNFVSEQLGNPKQMESLTSVLKAFWRVINSNFGNVRVDFAQPFSLREIINALQSRGIGKNASQLISMGLPQSSTTEKILGKNCDIESETQKQMVKCMAEHITFDATHCMSIMTTNLLSFLLLNKFRDGATKQQVVNSMTWLLEEVHDRGRDVGFVGDSHQVVDHALAILGCDLIELQHLPMENSADNENASVILLKPSTELPHVIELAYYSNVLLSVFLMDGIVASSVVTMVDDDLFYLRDCDSKITISRQLLHERATLLCDILRFEFIFAPFCSNLSFSINDAIDRLLSKDILFTATDIDTKQQQWAKRIASSLAWDSEEEEEETVDFVDHQFKINLSEESLTQLEFFSNVLRPIIESYWLFACNLSLLVHTQMEEREFFKRTQLSISNQIAAGLVFHSESLSADALRNAAKLLESWNILEVCSEDSIKLIYLTEEYDNEEKLTEIIDVIEKFKK